MPPVSPLRAAGLRHTAAREAVLGDLGALQAPMTHAALAELPRLRDMDPVTLYRTLATLVDAGLAHRVPGPDGTWRYCPQPLGQGGCPGNHAHFLCTACGTMRCLPDQPLPRVQVPAGARVHGRYLLAHGLCSGCGGEAL